MQIKIESSWKKELATEFDKPYFKELTAFVRKEYTSANIYPLPKYIFRALDECSFDKVKVVILGQDPYHGLNQANGLCFSVNEGVRTPPSLHNIYKELSSDLNTPAPTSGDLSPWVKQGVLLLNATLTVRAGNAGSHQNKGWEEFTDAVIRALNDKREHLVFMLWGAYAQKKGAFIDRKKHLVLEAPHPSPFSAARGSFGCRHSRQANTYLKEQGITPIVWVKKDA